jgi:predicted transcriptional regulator
MTSLRPFSDSPRQTRILLSIKPQYAAAILRGVKKYEFRRTIFSRRVDVVLLYVSTPVQRVVAEFDVLSVISKPLPMLWKKTGRYAGIDKASFFNYFKGHHIGHAIKIGEVRQYNEPFCPVKELGLMPPQSFSYLEPIFAKGDQ